MQLSVEREGNDEYGTSIVVEQDCEKRMLTFCSLSPCTNLFVNLYLPCPLQCLLLFPLVSRLKCNFQEPVYSIVSPSSPFHHRTSLSTNPTTSPSSTAYTRPSMDISPRDSVSRHDPNTGLCCQHGTPPPGAVLCRASACHR